jgi:amidohydrolase
LAPEIDYSMINNRHPQALITEAELDLMSSVHQDLTNLLRTVRRHLHANPELGFQEHKTSRYIREVLQLEGVRGTEEIAGTGLFVDIHGAHPGPMVAYRADIDALEAEDRKDVPYRSNTYRAAHLCGHDAHTAIAIGVAVILNGLKSHLHGSVRVFFQPNEEGVPSGAPVMIDNGVLKDVTAVYASHVDPTLEVGKFGLIAGPATASADRFLITVSSETSGHSARPHQTIDTVWVATQIATQLYQLVGRISDARNSAILTLCRFNGGHAFNVIPAEVEFGGTLRCIDDSERERLKNEILRIVSEMGEMYRADIRAEYSDGAPAVINHPGLVKGVATTISELFGEQAIVQVPVPSMGAEDFAFYLKYIPGMLLRVGTASSPDTAHPLHDSRFDIDEESLAPAAQLMACVLISHLKEQAIQEAAAI